MMDKLFEPVLSKYLTSSFTLKQSSVLDPLQQKWIKRKVEWLKLISDLETKSYDSQTNVLDMLIQGYRLRDPVLLEALLHWYTKEGDKVYIPDSNSITKHVVTVTNREIVETPKLEDTDLIVTYAMQGCKGMKFDVLLNVWKEAICNYDSLLTAGGYMIFVTREEYNYNGLCYQIISTIHNLVDELGYKYAGNYIILEGKSKEIGVIGIHNVHGEVLVFKK